MSKKVVVLGSACFLISTASYSDDIGTVLMQTNKLLEKSIADITRKQNEEIKNITRDSRINSSSKDAIDNLASMEQLRETKSLIDCLQDKVIYGSIGSDNRINYYCGSDFEKMAADSTAAFMFSQRLTPDTDPKFVKIENIPSNLCSPQQASSLGYLPERFYDEPASAYCSGFKIGDNLIATAGHCIPTQNFCNNTKIVFGFHRSNPTQQPMKVNSSDVYQCKSIKGGNFEPDTLNPDWRVIEVDRAIEGRVSMPLNLASDKKIQKGKLVTVLGHPMGLPLKITRDAKVTAVENNYFVADSDTYGGNSGSAVVDAEKLAKGEILVEGIFVRGARDFDLKQPCLISHRCENVGDLRKDCGGESSTYSWMIKDAVTP